MNWMYAALAALAIAFVIALIRYLMRPSERQLVEIAKRPDVVSHVTHGDVREDIERKPKRMKSRSRKK